MRLVIIPLPPPVPADQSTSLSKPLTGSKQAEITLVAIPLSLAVASNVHLLDLEITNTDSPHHIPCCQHVSVTGHGAGAGDVHDPVHDPHGGLSPLPGQVRGVSSPLQK